MFMEFKKYYSAAVRCILAKVGDYFMRFKEHIHNRNKGSEKAVVTEHSGK